MEEEGPERGKEVPEERIRRKMDRKGGKMGGACEEGVSAYRNMLVGVC